MSTHAAFRYSTTVSVTCALAVLRAQYTTIVLVHVKRKKIDSICKKYALGYGYVGEMEAVDSCTDSNKNYI